MLKPGGKKLKQNPAHQLVVAPFLSFSGHFSHNSNLQTESTVAAHGAANRVLPCVQNNDKATLPRETSAIIKAGKTLLFCRPP